MNGRSKAAKVADTRAAGGDLSLNRRTSGLKTFLDAIPGAVGSASVPGVLIYKVMGKMFAILCIKHLEAVILKCHPHMVQILREQYHGVGHRGHLDRRYWICARLDADVPPREIKRLVRFSYGLVCGKLTRKQQAELDTMSSSRGVS